MSVSILRIRSLWLVRKNMYFWRMDHLPSLSIPGCWRRRSEDQTLAALLSSGKTALFKLSEEGKRSLWISDKIRQSSEATNIGWSPYVERSRCEAADCFWLNEVGRLYVWLWDWSPCLSLHLHPSTLSTSYVLFCWLFQHFLENWWWSFVERYPTWTWWQRANGDLSWRRDRPQSARRHLRSCCSWWSKTEWAVQRLRKTTWARTQCDVEKDGWPGILAAPPCQLPPGIHHHRHSLW